MPTPDVLLDTYAGPLAVTLAYLLVYYGFIIRVAIVKSALAARYREQGAHFDRYFDDDREMLAADRAQLNMLEQMPPFLVLLWLSAVFVDPLTASILGGVYVVSRGMYPVVMGARLGRGVRASILLSTLPGYLVMLAFLGLLGWALLGQVLS
jgi:hypothetical protein